MHVCPAGEAHQPGGGCTGRPHPGRWPWPWRPPAAAAQAGLGHQHGVAQDRAEAGPGPLGAGPQHERASDLPRPLHGQRVQRCQQELLAGDGPGLLPGLGTGGHLELGVSFKRVGLSCLESEVFLPLGTSSPSNEAAEDSEDLY